MARAKEITFTDFRRRYADETACRNELYSQKFPNGFVCPQCGNTECCFIRRRNLCQCSHCSHQTSVTAGTVMHRTHLPLTIWFWAIYLCVTDKRGISAKQLSQTLGICYESAWYLLTRIRKAMSQKDAKYKLSGIIEMDDGYIGGPTSNGKRGRGTGKSKFVVAVSKSENGKPGFACMQIVDNLQSKSLQDVIEQNVEQNSVIECDGYKSYLKLENVEIRAKSYMPGDLNWLHKAISNLKTFLLGTYHGRCRNLQSYLDEFCFRFNRRHFTNQLFSRLTRAVATSCGMLS